MSNVVNINISDQTKPLTEVGMNKILVFTNSADVGYKEVNDIASATELTAGSTGYKLLELVLGQAKQDVAIFGVSAISDSEIKTQLNTIAGNDFFFVVSDITSVAGIKAISEWATSSKRIAILSPLVTQTKEEGVALAGEINSQNVGLYAHAGSPKGSGQVFLNAGIAGLMSIKPVGSAMWALKSPNLIPKIFFDLATENALIAGNVNVWAEELGRGVTKGGKTTDGSYLDITQGKYWLENKLRANLTLLFMNADKIPFTDAGRIAIINSIQDVVNSADAQGIVIADETTINVPEPLEILTNDRANRKWTGITIQSRIQGAVESIDVTYILTV